MARHQSFIFTFVFAHHFFFVRFSSFLLFQLYTRDQLCIRVCKKKLKDRGESDLTLVIEHHLQNTMPVIFRSAAVHKIDRRYSSVPVPMGSRFNSSCQYQIRPRVFANSTLVLIFFTFLQPPISLIHVSTNLLVSQPMK